MNFELSNGVISLLVKVTQYCRDPFISKDLGQKFANAINFCVDQLTTQKGLKFKIADPQRFKFEPKQLLANLICMYANMGVEQSFKEFVVSDGRSYSDETFAKAVKIISDQKRGINVGQEEHEKFCALVAELQELSKAHEKNDVSAALTTNLGIASIRRCS